MSKNMYDVSWSKRARYLLSAVLALGTAAALAACSSGISPFSNANPTPYSHPNARSTAAMPPMPPQPFTGNQYAAARAAAARRPIYVYQPAPPPYRRSGYATAPNATRPHYVAQPGQPARVRASRATRTRNDYRSGNSEGKIIIVRWGDTLYGIARAHGINIDQLKAVNGIQGSYVKTGRKLFIPGIGSHHRLPAAPRTGPRRGIYVAQN